MQNENSVTSGTTGASSPRGVFKSLVPGLRKALAEEGYVTPTPIQTQCIPPLLLGRDVLGVAQTGTGKTAAFALPLLQHMAKNSKPRKRGRPRALVLAPTRELANQINESFKVYGRHMASKTAVVYGGVRQNPQVRDLSKGPEVLIATPGRLLDLMGQGFANLGSVECFILDEVDRMLDMGFINDIRKIIGKIPRERQTMFFSATMAGKMKPLADSMLNNPVEVRITPEKPTVDGVEQKVFFVSRYDKDDLLGHILADPSVSKAIVFTQMKHTANKVVQKLSKSGVRGVAIHGNKSQAARTKSLEGFKSDKYDVLVATDVAARGLDVDSISHVINYDLPVEAETYVHRIGRTARAGAMGDAISFCCRDDRMYLRDIERLLGKDVPVDIEQPYHSETVRLSRDMPAKTPNRGGRSSGGSGGSYRSRSRRRR